jgi:hypothetical protein
MNNDITRLNNAGFTLLREKFINGRIGWTLRYLDEGYCFIGDHGCVSPTRREAIAEAMRRIDDDPELQRFADQ